MNAHTTTRNVQDLQAWPTRIAAAFSGWMLRIVRRADTAAPPQHRRMGSWEAGVSLRARALRDCVEERSE